MILLSGSISLGSNMIGKKVIWKTNRSVSPGDGNYTIVPIIPVRNCSDPKSLRYQAAGNSSR